MNSNERHINSLSLYAKKWDVLSSCEETYLLIAYSPIPESDSVVSFSFLMIFGFIPWHAYWTVSHIELMKSYISVLLFKIASTIWDLFFIFVFNNPILRDVGSRLLGEKRGGGFVTVQICSESPMNLDEIFFFFQKCFGASSLNGVCFKDDKESIHVT